jgi:hypothetical protein
MQASYHVWQNEYDYRDRKIRSAGTAVTIRDNNGREFMSFAVPAPQIGLQVTELLNEYLARHTPHELKELLKSMLDVAFYSALYNTQFVTTSEEEE